MDTHLKVVTDKVNETLSRTVIVMKKDLAMAVTGRQRGGGIHEVLTQEYLKAKQELRQLVKNDEGIVEVATKEELGDEVKRLMESGLKVIILDDGTLTEGFRADGSIPGVKGQAGVDYCVITTSQPRRLEGLNIPFINLKAMAMMGVGVLTSDTLLFELAYKAFTGKDAPESYLQDISSHNRWLIDLLPRIVRLPNELDIDRRLKTLFAFSA